MPFIQTALIGIEGESIIHFGAYKTRVVGAGNLDAQLFDIESVRSQVLSPITMAATTEDEPIRLSNFNTQRAMLRLSTDAIDEIINITRIILYVKELWTDFPR